MEKSNVHIELYDVVVIIVQYRRLGVKKTLLFNGIV